MNQGYKHNTRFSFENIVWHKVTKDKGMIVAIELYPTHANYVVVFEGSVDGKRVYEIEITDEQPELTTELK